MIPGMGTKSFYIIQPHLEGSEDDVTKQMRDAWPMINLLFMQEKNECRVNKSKTKSVEHLEEICR